MKDKTIKWIILGGAFCLTGCSSTSYTKYEKPLPVASKGETNFHFFSKITKSQIASLQRNINTSQADVDCESSNKASKSSKPKPLARPTPRPPNINSSGYCQIRFNVTKSGATRDIEILKCTHESFAKPVIASTAQWRYEPSENTDACGIEAKLHFKVTDERGKVLRVPNGF